MPGRILDFVRRLRVPKQPTPDEFERDYELKKEGLECVLGPMHDWVGHAIIPYEAGGPVDMYYFPQPDGTAVATMELLRPDGSGPLASRIGTYELVAFTRHVVGRPASSPEFEAIEKRLRSLLTAIGRYSEEAVLNPYDTCEIPAGDGVANHCVVLDAYPPSGAGFRVGSREHGLLLVVQVHRSEMEYARAHAGAGLIQLLRARGYYPFSDLDRPAVA